jgi:hypothetical protein
MLVLLLLKLALLMLFCTLNNECILFREHTDDAWGEFMIMSVFPTLVVFADNIDLTFISNNEWKN